MSLLCSKPSSDSCLHQSPSQRPYQALPCLLPLPWDLKATAHLTPSAPATLASSSLNCRLTLAPGPLPLPFPPPGMLFSQIFPGPTPLPPLGPSPSCSLLEMSCPIPAQHFPPPFSASLFAEALSTTRNSVCLAHSLISLLPPVELQGQRDFCPLCL